MAPTDETVERTKTPPAYDENFSHSRGGHRKYPLDGLFVSRRAPHRDIVSQAADTTREAFSEREAQPRGAD